MSPLVFALFTLASAQAEPVEPPPDPVGAEPAAPATEQAEPPPPAAPEPLAPAATTAEANEAHAPIDLPRNVLTLRFGSLVDGGATADRPMIAPYAGLGYARWLGRVVGLGARYDLSSATRGTSEATVTRLGQRLSATVDARWIFHPGLSLHSAVGGGASWLLATTTVGEASQSAGRVEGVFVWHLSFDVRIPTTPFGVTLGASGFVGNVVMSAAAVGLELLFD